MEVKPSMWILYDEVPEQKVTFIDAEKNKGEIVSVYPLEIDWDTSKQRADVGIFKGTQYGVVGRIEYSSFAQMINEIRKVAPDVEVIKTIVPEDGIGRVVIY